ncbi:MAG: VWA domain-containing protein [Myxococcota bacterium]
MKNSEQGTSPSVGRSPLITFCALFVLAFGVIFAARYSAEANEPTPAASAGPAAAAAALGEGTRVGSEGDLSRVISQSLVSLEGRLDRGAVHVGSDGLVHLELVAKGALPDRFVSLRRPTDLVVVLDRSGSMGGDPMRKALASIRELIGQLGVEDRLGLVTYSNQAELFLPLARATDPARTKWIDALNQIAPGGGTNMSAGLDRAHALVTASESRGRVTRVILLSDGHANQGDATPEGLSRRSARAIRSEYVLSTVGVGEGFDERLMTRLADAGTGNFYYVPDVRELGGIFAAEFDSARGTVASALEIRIHTPKGVEVVDAAGYPLEKQGDYVMIRPGALFGGQQRSFWVTLRVPAAQAGKTALGDVALDYTTLEGERKQMKLASFSPIEAVVDEATFMASLDGDAVKTHYLEERVNRLRQSVSSLVARGDYAAAQSSLDSVDYSELKGLGYAVEETESFAAVEQLKKEVEQAASAPLDDQAEVQNRLGKQLYESGTDGRRKGAKR